MSDYRPISCIEHERLDYAVLKQQRLNCRFVADGGVEQQRVLRPTDVSTREGAEWLKGAQVKFGATQHAQDDVACQAPS